MLRTPNVMVLIAGMAGIAVGQTSTALSLQACELSEFNVELEQEQVALHKPVSTTSTEDLRSEWVSKRDVTVIPIDPDWRIAGSAGLEILTDIPCFMVLPDLYFTRLHLASARSDIRTLGLGICDPKNGICYWKTVEAAP